MSNTELKSLIRKRGGIKASLTAFVKFIDDVESAESVNELKYLQIKERVTKIEDLFRQFSEVQTNVEELCDEASLKETYEQRNEFESIYFDIIARAREISLNFETIKVNNEQSDAQSVAGSDSLSGVRTNRANNTSFDPSLPKIPLPKFSGLFEDWLEFRDPFNTMIHNNYAISNVQKMHYLRSSLQGQAAQLLKALKTTDSNYQIAWNLLLERYDNKCLLVDNHIAAILSLPAMKNESASELRRIFDDFSRQVLILETLEQPVAEWATILIHIMMTKVDSQTKRKWKSERQEEKNVFPTIDDIKDFLRKRCELLESLQPSVIKHFRKGFKDSTMSLTVRKTTINCEICNKEDHVIYACQQFKNMSTEERSEKVKQKALCFNCLKAGHFTINCMARGCKRCERKHHTMLHRFMDPPKDTDSQSIKEAESQDSTVANCSTTTQGTLLSTAIINVEDSSGTKVAARALLDSGSENCFITKSLLKKLNAPRTDVNVNVIGINERTSRIRHKVHLKINSIHYPYQKEMCFYVIDKITQGNPTSNMYSTDNLPNYIKLADDQNTENRHGVDILLGTNIFWEILCSERHTMGPNMPIIQKTMLGWVIAGPVPKTTTQDEHGRYIVSIPFKKDPEQHLGESFEIAKGRFHNLEKRLNKDPHLKHQYVSFINEYIELGHMSRINEEEARYYMPHHGVQKQTSLTTKLRVVFDGSCKTTSGVSINDCQHVGPVIQPKLFNLLLQFRTYKYVLSADVEKMYRQVWVKSEERKYQCILWRENSEDPLRHYTLNTVTYGTAAAPYLATRSLQETTRNYLDIYPKACQAILDNFYVDDLLTGANSIKEAISLYEQISLILNSACFPLRKWITNDPELLQTIPSSATNELGVQKIGSDDIKTLGLYWSPESDSLRYQTHGKSEETTKRELLSSISKLFDPLGLVAPCVVMAKLILQELWQNGCEWDEPLPQHIQERWNFFKSSLTNIETIKIPRYTPGAYDQTELHIFSDASEKAYGSCAYLKHHSQEGCQINLLCAKSKIAPLKKTTIPRLELCGALLSTRLAKNVQTSLKISDDNIYFWCDSMIVLCWLRTDPNTLRTYVAHRIQEIQGCTDTKQWRHVRTEENPADILSRGCTPCKLDTFWWNGPSWLCLAQEDWPFSQCQESCLPEMKTIPTRTLKLEETNEFPFNKYSSFTRMVRITAWCLRFIRNVKTKEKRDVGLLSVKEINVATMKLIYLAQKEHFQEEVEKLKNNDETIKGSLSQLSPFIDNDGIIRVGGRLKNADFIYKKKHPIVLPGKHILTQRLMEKEHVQSMHAGPQLMLSNIRQNFWPTSGRNVARKVAQNCIVCVKNKPVLQQQYMGDLPKHRLLSMFPFYAVGIDYAGPFTVKSRVGRGQKTYKCYIALFVCLSTKAIHLEVVSELTSNAFIATFRRFIARRGKPSYVYPDNGTNFVGATSQLKELGNCLITNQDKITDTFVNEGIQWHFIPANSPHFGGLWEAGVKATKHHLRRVLLNAQVTFEDFLTIITQIEGILNSRPLHPLSTSPNDFESLTPSHFLLGRSSTALPDQNLDVPTNRLSRFQLLQKLVQHFWRRWSREYISELQTRSKWRKKQPNLQVGDLVLIKDDNLPPFHWKMGRIIQTHPRTDNLVRVVSIKCANGVVKRPVVKLALLPIEDEDRHN